MILHTLNKAPGTPGCSNCLNLLGTVDGNATSPDSLLLLEDGVYLGDIANLELIKQLNVKIYAIAADIEARGLTNRYQSEISLVSYIDFVRLVTEHKLTKSWI